MITYRKIPTNFKTEKNIGLGNQMFFMASTIGIATKCGYQYGFEKFYPDVFPNQAPECERFRPFVHIPWGYHDIRPADGTILYGYMQSEKYFSHCRDLVLWHFEMLPQSDRVMPADAVCVHVRRGDYVNSAYHYNLGHDYYDEAIKIMGGTPVIFTDDAEYCKREFPGVEVVSGDVFHDLYLMRQCKKFIIANSSLSWWASWLSGGDTIAPRNWFAGPNRNLSTEDLYCKDWIVL